MLVSKIEYKNYSLLLRSSSSSSSIHPVGTAVKRRCLGLLAGFSCVLAGDSIFARGIAALACSSAIFSFTNQWEKHVTHITHKNITASQPIHAYLSVLVLYTYQYFSLIIPQFLQDGHSDTKKIKSCI